MQKIYLPSTTTFKLTKQNIVSLINLMQQQFTLYKSNQQAHNTNLKLLEALKESKSIRILKRPTYYEGKNTKAEILKRPTICEGKNTEAELCHFEQHNYACI